MSTTPFPPVHAVTLTCDGQPVACLELATTPATRTRGLLGRDGIDGAILIEPTSGVHTFRMRFAIDVAFCDRDRRVIKVRTMPPGRLSLHVRGTRSVVEAEAGAFGRWGITTGSQLGVDYVPPV